MIKIIILMYWYPVLQCVNISFNLIMHYLCMNRIVVYIVCS